MDQNLKSYLEKHHIAYQVYEHPAVFTVAESKSIKIQIPGIHTKCLFLKDENGQFYLIALPAEKRLNTKELKQKLNIKELKFANQVELKQHLNITPGSVSLFCMIYAKKVFLLIDKELWQANEVGFHPNVNTATLIIDHHNLEKLYNSINSEKEIITL